MMKAILIAIIVSLFLAQGCGRKEGERQHFGAITNGQVVLLVCYTNDGGWTYSGSFKGGTYRDYNRIIEVHPDRVRMGSVTHAVKGDWLVVDLTSDSGVSIDGVRFENKR
jgi:hypothetical protein